MKKSGLHTFQAFSHDTLHNMKRLGVFVISAVLITIGHLFPSTALAYLTDQDLQTMRVTVDTFSTVDGELGRRLHYTVSSVYDRFKNDPDVDIHQFKRYVFDGIPGATDTYQQGYIPYLERQLGATYDDVKIRNLNTLIAQSRQIRNGAVTREQVAGGTLTQAQGISQILDNANASRSTQNAAQQTLDDAQKKAEADSKECGILFKGSIVDCIDVGVAWLIKNTLLRIAGVVLWLCANMLNFAIDISIFSFSKWANTGDLYGLWIVIRQIVSLAIVFAGIYLGFMYIIGREDTFGKYIGWVVIFALFVNFSYPLSRMLVDVSNVVSLNVYSTAIPGGITGTDEPSTGAGDMVMQRLGLQNLVSLSTGTGSADTAMFDNIKSTPLALVTVVLVGYAAYVFFMATAIIAMRTAVLVFLIIASPFLLVDAVVPKMGEIAVKMRKIFFEQLAVAPVFTIMFALTLKFMDIFKRGVFGDAQFAPASNGLQDASNIKLFFSVIMMLVMLHIMLKVTRSLAGEAGNFATNALGKVGTFGAGLAVGGTGLLARGTIGAAAARARDSGWMDKMQSSRMGRGLYGLSNSLAQSTFDARNVGMVNKGLATAGIRMGAGSTNTYDKNFAAKQEQISKKYSSIKDGAARQAYYDHVRNGPISRAASKLGIETSGAKISRQLDLEEMKLKQKESATMDTFTKGDATKRKQMILEAQKANNKPLAQKLASADKYFEEKAIKPVQLKEDEKVLAVLKNDLDEDTKFYKEKASKHAQKVGDHTKEEKSIQHEEEELDLMSDKNSSEYKQKKLKLDRRKGTFERDKQEMEEESREIDTLYLNLQEQKAQYEEEAKKVAGGRSEYINDVASKKASSLSKLDSKTAMDIIEKDTFAELTQDTNKEIQALQDQLSKETEGSVRGQALAVQIKAKKEEQKKVVEDLRDAVRNKYHETTADKEPLDFEVPDVNPDRHTVIDAEHPGGSDFSHLDASQSQGPGGSDMSKYGGLEYQIPAVQRKLKNAVQQNSETGDVEPGSNQVGTEKSGFLKDAVEIMRDGKQKNMGSPQVAQDNSTEKPVFQMDNFEREQYRKKLKDLMNSKKTNS